VTRGSGGQLWVGVVDPAFAARIPLALMKQSIFVAQLTNAVLPGAFAAVCHGAPSPHCMMCNQAVERRSSVLWCSLTAFGSAKLHATVSIELGHEAGRVVAASESPFVLLVLPNARDDCMLVWTGCDKETEDFSYPTSWPFRQIDPENAVLTTHPLVLAGLWGVFFNALQLLPLARLDGARMVGVCFAKVDRVQKGS
jgi:hypothetical protein